MDEHTLRQTLHEIAQEAVPVTTDRRKEIMEKAEMRNKRVPIGRLSRAALLLALFFVISATAYAVYQSQKPQSGVEGAREAGLVTEINQSETIDDVTLTLNWAYADGSRVVVGLSPTVPDDEGKPQAMDFSQSQSAPLITYRLRDKGRNILAEFPSGGTSDSFQNEITANFDLPLNTDLPETLDLTLEVIFENRPSPTVMPPSRFEQINTTMGLLRNLLNLNNPTHRAVATLVMTGQFLNPFPIWGSAGFSSSSSIGGGSGDRNRPRPEDTAEPQPLDVPADGVGVFTFEFTIPLLPAVVVEPNQTVEDQGITLTLERVMVAPSKIEAQFCGSKQEGHFFPEAELTIGGQQYEGSASSQSGKRLPCIYYDFGFDVFTRELPDQLTLKFSALDNSNISMEDWRKIAELVADEGVVIEVTESSVSFTYNTDYELGEAALNAAKVELGYRIEGDWTFVVDLP